MPLPNNTQDYANVSQGIDRITEILKQQSTPQPYASLQPQAINLPDNIINMISGSSMAFGNSRKGSSFAENVQNYMQNEQNAQINQQKMLLNAYEEKLKMGDAQAKALNDKITMFTGGDPEGTALFLQELHSDPETIDPTNSFQIMTKLAGIAKRTGYVSPELQLDRQSKQADIAFKNAQAHQMSNKMMDEVIGYGAPYQNNKINIQQPVSVPNKQDGGMTLEQANTINDLYGGSSAEQVQPQISTQKESGPIALYKGNKPYTEGLEKGYQWAEMPDGTRAAMKIPTITAGGNKEVTPQTRIFNTVSNLADDYNSLKKMGAGISQEQSFLQNKFNQVLLSENVVGNIGGQTIMKGTPQQAVVERIKSNIPALLLDLKPASEAGAKQFDSDRDVTFMMQQASNPTNDFASNMIILNRIAKKYTNQNLPNFFDNEAQAESANLPPGSMIFINGREAVVE